MAKVKVPVFGTVGKAVMFDPEAGARAEAAVEALAQAISQGVGGVTQHSTLQGLQVGDDHPQYTMWQAPETIQGQWNFQTIPNIQGDTLAEYIEDVVGGSLFDFLQDTSSVVWTYHETANELEANVPPEFVQDTVGAMLVDSTSIDFTYDDAAGTFTASTINANPTGIIGLAAVNGTAATPMRSDAAPALSQAIAPTWSALHTFSLTPVVPNDSWTYAKIQNVSATSRVLGRISSGAGDIEELTGTDIATILGSAIPSPANPTASVGLSAVNGSATTYMRSDAAPPISQSIVPTWSGSHTFTADAFFTSTNIPLTLSGTDIVMAFNETDAPSDSKLWWFRANSQVWSVQLRTDAGGAGSVAFQVVRSGTTSTALQLPNDNEELRIGDGNDLRLYHNGTDSIIENDTGNLILRVNGELSIDEVTSSTSATGGAATALPALPQGYVTVIINGTSRKIPYYAT